jgi:xanthine dehydrogenase YagS FAD-binding subunit
MRTFLYQRAREPNEAVQLAAAANPASAHSRNKVAYLAGGTTLTDLMKLDVAQPDVIIDINPLTETGHGRIELSQRGLRLGALVRMAEAADHFGVKSQYPVVAQSLSQAASQQLRNMASLGGNVLQRTRCPYFRDVSYSECNKRNPGSGCAALTGFNRMHAVLGASDQCIATYPGDFAQALIALEATVEIAGSGSSRTIPFANLHRKPDDTPDQETSLRPGEIITSFLIPAAPWTRRSLYLNDNLADYLVPVNADVKQVEVILVSEIDNDVNPAGVKGLGELANVGTAAAIANAVYHATGKRIRQLPIRIESVLSA